MRLSARFTAGPRKSPIRNGSETKEATAAFAQEFINP
jgi:hypothetical protein